jgi:hypothetical protein
MGVRRHRLIVVTGLGAALYALRRDDPKGPCEAGVKWAQAPTNRTEGTVAQQWQ